jgi:superoxide dismutase, Fe-Mn family
MAFTLPNLPFGYDALDPHMSANTLKFHHDKHHKTYVDKLNKAIEGTPYAELALGEIIQQSWKKDPDVFNNAGQHWNHSFFWQCLSPQGGGEPSGDLKRQIEKDFGDLAAFQKEFAEKAAAQFGSGWAWLVLDGEKLKVITTGNAELPMLHGQQALLTCDVWEHAYYLDYQNERPKFIDTYLKKLANWKFAAERFELRGEGDALSARDYQTAQHSFAKSGAAERGGRQAASALDSEEGSELEDARKRTGERAKRR